jgi:hypothetical protein
MATSMPRMPSVDDLPLGEALASATEPTAEQYRDAPACTEAPEMRRRHYPGARRIG